LQNDVKSLQSRGDERAEAQEKEGGQAVDLSGEEPERALLSSASGRGGLSLDGE